MSLEELGEKLEQAKEQRAVAEHALAALRRGQHKIEELEANNRALLEAYSSGLLLGIDLFTSPMRRAVHEMLRLDIIVPLRSTRVRSMVDANVVRMTRKVEEYATRFLEVHVNGLSLDDQSLVESWRAALSSKPTDKVMAEVIS